MQETVSECLRWTHTNSSRSLKSLGHQPTCYAIICGTNIKQNTSPRFDSSEKRSELGRLT
jgi:hypothetical protein